MFRPVVVLAFLTACGPVATEAPKLQPPWAGVGATFTEAVRLEDRQGTWSVDLTHRAWGREGAMTPIGDVTPRMVEDRVVYEGDGIVAWYASMTEGIKQGFDVAERPPGDGPLRVETAVASDLVPLELHDGVRFLGADGITKLLVDELVVHDADGVELPSALSWACDTECSLRIEVDDDGARYPIAIDPRFWTVQQRFLNPIASPGADRFGFSVAIDGDLAVVGAPVAVNNRGRVVIYRRSGSTWAPLTEVAPHVGNDTGREFGASVAVLDAAGLEQVVVGAPSSGVSGGSPGRVYTFTINGTGGQSNRVVLEPSGANGARVGASVALVDDRLVIGAPGTAGGGAAWVYRRTAPGTWALDNAGAPLVASFANGGGGTSVALSSDGSTVALGAPTAAAGGANRGRVAVFTRAGTTWTEEAVIDSTLAAGSDTAQFGAAVDVDGDTLVVGAPRLDANGIDSGAAEVFTRSGLVWSSLQTFVGPTAQDLFGSSVALEHEVALVVGAPFGDTPDHSNVGEAHVHRFDGASYVLENVAVPSNPAYDQGARFASSLALDGSDLVVGGPWLDPTPNFADSGVVFFLAGVDDATDADSDGFIAVAGGGDDCDDSVGAVNPLGTELEANGIDENCDGFDATCGTLAVGGCLPHIVINEIMGYPAPGSAVPGSNPANAHWVELMNASPHTVDLRGSWISSTDGADREYQVSGFQVLAPGEIALFGDHPSPALNGGITPDEHWNLPANVPLVRINGSGKLSVLDAERAFALDEVIYNALNTSGGTDSVGSSYSLDPDFADADDNDVPTYWCDARSTFGGGQFGTPGLPNDDCDYDLTFDYAFATPAVSGTATISFHFDDTDRWFTTDNAGEGAYFRGTSANAPQAFMGQQTSFLYEYTDTTIGPVYVGLQDFGTPCLTGGVMEEFGGPGVLGTWTVPACPP